MIKISWKDRLFDGLNALVLTALMFVTAYPFLFVLFASFSEPNRFLQHSGILWAPIGFSLKAYRLVLENPMISIGYRNTLFIVAMGSILNVVFTALFAYVLSRPHLYWKNAMMMLVVFTMFFSGGLIPEYILVKELGLVDSRWALILPGLISTWNLIIMRTSFQGIPNEMEESAKMDGAGDFTIFLRIILPLSVPMLSVMVLFYGVAHWNAWANAMIYVKKTSLYPLQLVLREILIVNSTADMTSDASMEDDYALSVILKYATIIVSTFPILVLYPFIQKNFAKGVLVGALKG